MSAWDQPIQRSKGFKKSNRYTWASGYNYMRPIGEPHILDIHYVQNTYVKCLGSSECPICKQNKQLYTEYGKEAKNRGVISASPTIYFNVVDRTLGKICPNPECGADVKKSKGVMPNACPKCNTLLVSIPLARLNAVRLVRLSRTAFEELQTVASMIVDDEGNKLPIGTYDLCFNSVGENETRRSKPEVPETLNREEVTYKEEDLNDLTTAYFTLSAEEITNLLKGMQLKDILSARKASSNVPTSDVPVATEQTKEDIKKRIASLMTDDE